jgi:hypothetical protein
LPATINLLFMSDPDSLEAKEREAAYAVYLKGGGVDAMQQHLERVRRLRHDPEELDRYLQGLINESRRGDK